MSIIEAIFLGLVQGLTEFIPISSTAHLTIAGHIMGGIDPAKPEQWTAFIAVIQLGTLAAVIIYFAKDIWLIVNGFIKENLSSDRIAYKEQSMHSRLGWLIIIGSIPVVIVGILLKDFIEGDFTKNLSVIGASLIALAILLLIAEKKASLKKDIDKISILDSIVVGIAQCLALIPGSSRSGTTLTAGLFLGMKRDTAARFSFLLSIPAIFGSGLLEFYESLDFLSYDDAAVLITATAAAAISGYASISFLIKFLKTNSTMAFIIYRLIAGAALLTAVYFNLI